MTSQYKAFQTLSFSYFESATHRTPCSGRLEMWTTSSNCPASDGGRAKRLTNKNTIVPQLSFTPNTPKMVTCPLKLQLLPTALTARSSYVELQPFPIPGQVRMPVACAKFLDTFSNDTAQYSWYIM
jgi:hypothetical protein